MSLTISTEAAAQRSQNYNMSNSSNNKPSSTIPIVTNTSADSQKIPDEPAGPKSQAWRERFIKEHKSEYDIKRVTYKSYKGFTYVMYEVTAKKDVNLAGLKEDLGLSQGVVSSNNDGYGQYDYNGHYIDNKPMKNVTIKIPIDKLGERYDDRSFFKQIWDAIF